MTKSVPGIPRPAEIWLGVRFKALTPDQLNAATVRLQKLPGWKTSLLGSKGGALRYIHTDRRARQLWGQAVKTLERVGIQATAETFVIWRVDWPFRREMEPKIFGPVAKTIEGYQGVLAAHSMGTYANGSHWGMYLEFKGEPWRELVRQTGEYLRPYTRM